MSVARTIPELMHDLLLEKRDVARSQCMSVAQTIPGPGDKARREGKKKEDTKELCVTLSHVPNY